ncbi:MAG: Crp/Fnr family transcriptional regulator [Elusimicrobiota bacterium]
MREPNRSRSKLSKSACASCVRSQSGPFSGLSDYMLRRLEGVKTKGVFARGQVLFQAGNRPLALHCIENGLVKLCRVGPAGKEQIIRLAVAGELLGYHALLAEKPHDLYAQAVTDVEVCCFPVDSVRSLLRGAPPMMRNLARMMAGEMAGLHDRLVQRSQQKAEERLIAFLLRCAEGLRGGADESVEIPLSRQEIADFIGAAPETVIRALGRLQRDRLIRVHGRRLEIPRADKLAAKLQTALY